MTLLFIRKRKIFNNNIFDVLADSGIEEINYNGSEDGYDEDYINQLNEETGAPEWIKGSDNPSIHS